MKDKKMILLIASLITFISISGIGLAANNVEIIDIVPNDVHIGEEVEIEINYSNFENEDGNLGLLILEGNYDSENISEMNKSEINDTAVMYEEVDEGNLEVEFDMDVESSGEYTAVLNYGFNFDENISTSHFTVYEYYFDEENIDINEMVYHGDSFEMFFEVNTDPENIGMDVDESIDVRFIEDIGSYEEFSFDMDSNGEASKVIDSEDLDLGVYDVEVMLGDHSYFDKFLDNVNVDNLFDVTKALDVSFSDSDVIEMEEGGTKALDVDLTVPDEGSFVDFSYEIDDTSNDVENVDCEADDTSENEYNCELELSIPDLSSGDYELVVEAKYDDFSDTTTREVHFTIPFSGELVDPQGSVIDAGIQMQNRDTGQWYETSTDSSDGSYSLTLLPGTYDIKIESPVIREILIEGVDIEPDSDMITGSGPIRIDSFTGGDEIEGIQPVEIFAVGFALDYDDAEIWARYDDTEVTGSEDDLELYACDDWRFGGRECADVWNNISFGLEKVTNQINFEPDELSSGFIIGNRKNLALSTTFDDSTYYSGRTVSFSGNVVDSDGSPIEGAEVTYGFEGTDTNNTAETGDNGYFTADLSAPEDTGIHQLELKAEKDPYVPVSATENVEITYEKDFSVSSPSGVELGLGETEEMEVTITNVGQVSYDSVDISLQGISNEWYNIDPRSITDFESDEVVDVVITFEVPPEECEDECALTHPINLIVNADDDERTESFDLELDPDEVVEDDDSLLPTDAVGEITGRVATGVTSPVFGSGVFLIIMFFVVRKLKGENNVDSGYSGNFNPDDGYDSVSSGSSKGLPGKVKNTYESSKFNKKKGSVQSAVPVFKTVKDSLKENEERVENKTTVKESKSVSVDAESPEEMERKLDRLRKEKDSKKNKLSELKDKKSNISRKEEELKNKIRTVKDKIDNLEIKEKELKQDLQQTEADIDDLNSKLNQIKQDRKENRRTLKKLKNKLRKKKEELEDNKEKKSNLLSEISSLENKMENLRDRKQEYESKNEKLESKLSDIRRESTSIGFEDSEEDDELLSADKRAKQESIKAKERAYKQSKQDIESKIEKVSGKIREVSNNIDRKKSNISEIDAAKSRLVDEVNSTKNRIDNLKNKISRLKDREDDIDSEISELRDEKSSLNKDIKELEEKRKEKENETQHLERKRQKLDNKRSRIDKRLSKKQQNLENIQDKISQLEDRISTEDEFSLD